VTVDSKLKLSAKERKALDNIKERLTEQGLRVSDDRLILALLKAAASLPEGELFKLIQEGLTVSQPQDDPKPREE
jgi:hypothetical protein